MASKKLIALLALGVITTTLSSPLQLTKQNEATERGVDYASGSPKILNDHSNYHHHRNGSRDPLYHRHGNATQGSSTCGHLTEKSSNSNSSDRRHCLSLKRPIPLGKVVPANESQERAVEVTGRLPNLNHSGLRSSELERKTESTPVLESRDLNYPPKLKSGESKLATPKVRDDQDHEPQEQSKHLDQGLPKEGQRPGQDHGRYPDDGGSQEEKTKPHRRGNGRSYNSSRGGLWIHPLNVGYA